MSQVASWPLFPCLITGRDNNLALPPERSRHCQHGNEANCHETSPQPSIWGSSLHDEIRGYSSNWVVCKYSIVRVRRRPQKLTCMWFEGVSFSFAGYKSGLDSSQPTHSCSAAYVWICACHYASSRWSSLLNVGLAEHGKTQTPKLLASTMHSALVLCLVLPNSGFCLFNPKSTQLPFYFLKFSLIKMFLLIKFPYFPFLYVLRKTTQT